MTSTAVARAEAEARYTALANYQVGAPGTTREEALTLLESARGAAKTLGDDDASLRVEVFAAYLLRNEGRGREAKDALSGALERFPNATASRLDARIALAAVSSELEDKDGALAMLAAARNEAAAMLARLPAATSSAHTDTLRYLSVSASLERGQVLTKLGLADVAIAELDPALAVAQEIDAPEVRQSQIAYCELFRAQAAILTEDYAGIVARLTDEVIAAFEDPRERAQATLLRAQARSEFARDFGGDTAPARADLARVLELVPESNLWSFWCAREACDLSIRAGDFAAARDELERMRARFDRLRATNAVEQSPELLAAWARERAWLARASNAGADELRAALDDVRRALDGAFAYWSSAPLRPGGVGLLTFARWRCLLTELTALECALAPGELGLESALDAIARFQTLGSLARSLGAQPVTLAEVRAALLPEGTCLVLYLPGLEDTHVFALDATSIEHQLSSAHDDFLRKSRELDSLVATAPTAGGPERDASVQRLSGELSELAFPGAIRAMAARCRTLLVVGAELIGDPFLEVLALDDGEPLGCAKSIVYVPSLPVGVALARRPDLDHALAVACVPPPLLGRSVRERWPDLTDIPWSDGDARNLLRAFALDTTRVLERERATKSNVLDAARSGSAVFCFVGHGVWDASKHRDGERAGGLAVAEDSSGDDVLWCADIESAPFAPLVELIACRSGRGPKRVGDDVAGSVGGAFLRGGARTVVVGQADLDVEASLRMTELAHERLRDGASPAEAWRAARAAARSNSATRDPYYWGLVRVVGSPSSVAFPASIVEARSASSRAWLWIGGAVALGVLAAMVVSRRRRALPRLPAG